MTEPIRFFVPGTARGQGAHKTQTHYRGKDGQLHALPFAKQHPDQKSGQYRGLIQFHAQNAMTGREQLVGPMALTLLVIIMPPESWSDKKKRMAVAGLIKPEVKPDCDNVTKIIADALQSIVFADDKSITTLVVRKRFGLHAGVAVEICSDVAAMIDVKGDGKLSEAIPQQPLPLDSNKFTISQSQFDDYGQQRSKSMGNEQKPF
jgi:Holliday junction resolvase RusA-like endonuclease